MAEVINIPGVISLDTAQLSVMGVLFAALILTIIKLRFQTKRTASLQKMVGEMDTEKAEMYSKLKNFEDESTSLNERFNSMQREYTEKMKTVEEKEKSLDEKSKIVKTKVLEIEAMEDTIEMHRTKIGRLEMEKSDLERKLEIATKDVDKQMSLEKEKLKSHAKELTEKTKETLESLKKENEELKKKYETVKERLNLWESVE